MAVVCFLALVANRAAIADETPAPNQVYSFSDQDSQIAPTEQGLDPLDDAFSATNSKPDTISSQPQSIQPYANGYNFNRNNIISDAMFYNPYTMDAASIQRFLESKVLVCESYTKQLLIASAMPCLKDYRLNIPSMGGDNYCSTVSGGNNLPASEAIFRVAVSCGINPQVILATLQKEQSLVEDSYPRDAWAAGTNEKAGYQYRSAMGYGCPDLADCNSQYFGFFNQIYQASHRFRYYRMHPKSFGHVAGECSAIDGANVCYENQATAGLYNYTPHFHGNELFFDIITRWFGNPWGDGAVNWEPDKYPIPPSTFVPAGTFTIKSDLGTVLDINGGSTANGANVQMYASNGSNAQKFKFEATADGYYIITNVASGKVLDVAGGALVSGTNVWQHAKNGSNAQKWSIKEQGSKYAIISVASGRALDISGGSSANGANVQIYRLNGSGAQTWSLINSDTPVMPNGFYTVSSKLANNLVLDVAGGQNADGTNIDVYTPNSSNAQNFYISRTVEGMYNIRNVTSGKAVEAKSSGRESGTNVQLYTYTNTCAQKWILVVSGSGFYTLANNCSGKVLDVAGGLAAPATNVQIYDGNSSDAQKWSFSKEQDLTTPQSFDNQVVTIASSVNSGKVLDISGGSSANGANVWIYGSNSTNAQRFKLEKSPDDTYLIRNIESGKVLDVSGGKTANGSNVQQYDANNSCAQKWLVEDKSEYVKITSACVRMYSLDITGGQIKDGANVQIYEWNNSGAQKFKVTKTSISCTTSYILKNPSDKTNCPNIVSLSASVVTMESKSGKVLDIAGGSAANGANVQIYASNNSAAQKFTVIINDDGTYTFKNVASGKVLDVAGGSAANGTNVWQHSSNSSKAQKWIPLAASNMGDGYFTLISAASGLALDIAGGSAANGANVQVYARNGSAAQAWRAT